jgi:hypothetical protein
VTARSLLVIAGVFGLGAGLCALPIRLTHSIEVPGRIMAAREWMVKTESGGGIVTMYVDRIAGVVSRTTVQGFSRGDAAQLVFTPGVRAGASLSDGDTVAVIHSDELERELARLRGEEATALASLASTLSGQKESVIRGSQQELEHARREEDDLEAILVRQRLLFEKGLIAQQELETAERRTALAKISVSIAVAHLQSVSTGAKREETELMRARLREIGSEIAGAEQRLHSCIVRTPCPGVALSAGVNDTLLLVADTSAYVVLMPVPFHLQRWIGLRQHIVLTGRESGDLPSAVVTTIVSPVQMIGGGEVFLVTGQCERSARSLLHGALARCNIQCAPCTPFEYLTLILTRSIR